MLAGQAEDAEVTWRSLFACNNGWAGLRPGCAEVLELTSSAEWRTEGDCCPPYCTVYGRDLGWTAAAGDASELLVAVDLTSVQVTPCACSSSPMRSAWQAGRRLADELLSLAGD